MLIYTVATGRDYRALAGRQRQKLREFGYHEKWRCLTDAPEEFGPDGLGCDPAAGSDRTVNRRQKTTLAERCHVAPDETVIFLEADVRPEASLAPFWRELAAGDRVWVQRGWPELARMLRAQRQEEWTGEPCAPWCGLVAIPGQLREMFFPAWQHAHAGEALGFDEVALFSALQAVPWSFSDSIAFAGSGPAPFIHYQGTAKAAISAEFSAEIERRKTELLAAAGRPGNSISFHRSQGDGGPISLPLHAPRSR